MIPNLIYYLIYFIINVLVLVWFGLKALRDKQAVEHGVSATCDGFTKLCEEREFGFLDAVMAYENAFSQHADVIQRMEQRESTVTLISILCTVVAMSTIPLENPEGGGAVLLVRHLIPKLLFVAVGPIFAGFNPWWLKPARRALKQGKERAWEAVLERPAATHGVNPRQMKAVKKMSDSLAEVSRDMQEAARETKTTAQTIRETVEQVTVLVTETHARIQEQIEGVAGSLSKCMESEFEKGGATLKEQVDAVGVQLQERAEQLLSTLERTNSKYDQIITEMEGFDFASVGKKIDDDAQELKGQLNGILQSLAEQTTEISAVQRGHLEKMQQLPDQLASLASTMNDNVAPQVTAVKEALATITSIVQQQETIIGNLSARQVPTKKPTGKWYRPTTWFRRFRRESQ